MFLKKTVLALLAGVVLAGCGASPEAPIIDDKPFAEGKILRIIDHPQNNTLEVLVEGTCDLDVEEIYFVVNDETLVTNAKGQSTLLEIGQNVKAWTEQDPIILQMKPPKVRAIKMLIVDG